MAKAGDRIVVGPGTYYEATPIVLDKPVEIVARSALLAVPRLGAAGGRLADDAAGAGAGGAGGTGANDVAAITLMERAAACTPDPDVRISAQRGKLFVVDFAATATAAGAALQSGLAVLRGLQLASGSGEHPALSVTCGHALLEDCEVSGGHDCVAVDGADAHCTLRCCTLHGAAHSALSFTSASLGGAELCRIYGSPTGVIISGGANPSLWGCTVTSCGTGVLVRDGGLGTLSRCMIERNSKPGIIIAAKGNPVLRACTIRDGDSNGVFVRDEGKGFFSECAIYGNGLPGVATCNDSCPVLVGCTVHDGRNAGVLIYDNGRGVVVDCQIHNNHMPGIEVRANGNPIISGCEIFNGESNGVYVHNRGRGVFASCRVYENVLPGVAIRTAGNPLVHACAITTGKDNALMVCDKGRGVIVECVLHGYSVRPLEIRDGCTPIIQGCEMHDGKHRHVVDWLQQASPHVTPAVARELGWTD